MAKSSERVEHQAVAIKSLLTEREQVLDQHFRITLETSIRLVNTEKGLDLVVPAGALVFLPLDQVGAGLDMHADEQFSLLHEHLAGKLVAWWNGQADWQQAEVPF